MLEKNDFYKDKIDQIYEKEIEELKKIGKYTKENLTKIHNGYPVQYIIGYVNF